MKMLTKFTTTEFRVAKKEVEKVIRRHSKTFFFATGLLPVQSRQAIRALYAFCRATDDLVDRTEATTQDVENWRAKTDLPLSQQTDPNLLLWTQVRQCYRVNRRYENELIDGVSFDLTRKTYATWDALVQYCYHVASTVGLLSIPIVGLAPSATMSDALPYAVNLGIALQLTNILRDVGEDLQRDRIYLPLEDLRSFDLTPTDIRKQLVDDRFRALMRFQIKRAEYLYEISLPGIRYLASSARQAVGVAALLYRAILDEIVKLDFDVFKHRAHTTFWQKVSMLPGILRQVRNMPMPGEPPVIPLSYI
ncbi:MAG: phytoene/squalene synthase family protein [Anaerolineae bacterium]|nr:phytoene/squalene synthase family protein [Anaerolineae bacterium]